MTRLVTEAQYHPSPEGILHVALTTAVEWNDERELPHPSIPERVRRVCDLPPALDILIAWRQIDPFPRGPLLDNVWEAAAIANRTDRLIESYNRFRDALTYTIALRESPRHEAFFSPPYLQTSSSPERLRADRDILDLLLGRLTTVVTQLRNLANEEPDGPPTL